MELKKLINIVKLGRLIPHSAFIVYVLGALFALNAGATFNIYKFVFGYSIVFTSVLSAVYNNNYNDVNVDKYSKSTLFSGGSKVLVNHPELLKIVKRTAFSFLILSLLLAFLFMIIYSYPITFFLIVLIGNILAWFYTTPPIKLIYRGLGEIATMIGAGFLIPGLGYFVVMGKIDFLFFLFAIPFILYGFAIALNLAIPDFKADRKGNKKTLIVRRGTDFGFTLSLLLSSLATLSFILLTQLKFNVGIINFWFIVFISILPLSFCVYGFIKNNFNKKLIEKLAIRNLISIFLFIIMINAYFFLLILY